MIRGIKKSRLELAVERQQRAFGVFTQVTNQLSDINEDLISMVDEIEEEQERLAKEKEIAQSNIAENTSVINNIKKLLQM